MLCARCGGLLNQDSWDSNSLGQQSILKSTRCVNCGCVDDPVIRANRRQPRGANVRGGVSVAKSALFWN